jgi:CheY-like chemotaxis protein
MMEAKGRKILLVEDNPDDIELIQRALRKYNIKVQVEVVQDGEKALDYLFARGEFAEQEGEALPLVVLLDLKLPKVDGLEVLKALRADSRTKTLPIVVLTSSTQEEDVEQAYRSGANSFLHKPVNFGDFRQLVQQLGIYWLVDNEPPPQ